MPLKRIIKSRYKDGIILGADYGQLEFRIVGELSGDTKLIQDVVNGVDIHTQTAKLAFGLPEHIKDASEMNEEQKALRQRAKTKTFEFQYGAMPKTDVDQKIYDAFYRNYNILAGWQERMAAQVAQTQTYTCHVTGKIFKFPNATWANKGSWITKLKNYGTQFLASMVTQAAMRSIWEQIHARDDMCIILQVHDSIVLDVKPHALDEAARIVNDAMLNVSDVFEKYFNYKLKVPMGVDMEYGDSYTLSNTYKLTEE
jgi:DNA polymerase-1